MIFRNCLILNALSRSTELICEFRCFHVAKVLHLVGIAMDCAKDLTFLTH